MTVHALFFCLRPDAATALRLAATSDEIADRFGLRRQSPRAERLHVTLHHLGWFDDEQASGQAALADTRQRAEQAASSLTGAPFGLDFDELLSFVRKPRNRPLVLSGGPCLDAVRRLREDLGDSLTTQGVTVDPHFKPHLTLFYDDAAIPSQPMPVAGWTASDFHLMDSLQGQSRHVELARWPLTG